MSTPPPDIPDDVRARLYAGANAALESVSAMVLLSDDESSLRTTAFMLRHVRGPIQPELTGFVGFLVTGVARLLDDLAEAAGTKVVDELQDLALAWAEHQAGLS